MNISHELLCLFLEMYPKEITGNVMVLLKGEKEVTDDILQKESKIQFKI